MKTTDTRQRLLDAATDLIWNRSYGAVGVEDICEAAGVKKGSFYHFFKSKAELVSEALHEQWKATKQRLDAIFSPAQPPLDRLQHYFAMIYERQASLKRDTGHVPGCFYTSIGCETAKQEPAIGAKVCELIGNYCRYIESALRDAIAEGSIPQQDVKVKARAIIACVEGMMTQARITNDAEVLKSLAATGMAMIGAPVHATV
jgi:TetR/AcrR family transcriptional repressor of nem operon